MMVLERQSVDIFEQAMNLGMRHMGLLDEMTALQRQQCELALLPLVAFATQLNLPHLEVEQISWVAEPSEEYSGQTNRLRVEEFIPAAFLFSLR